MVFHQRAFCSTTSVVSLCLNILNPSGFSFENSSRRVFLFLLRQQHFKYCVTLATTLQILRHSCDNTSNIASFLRHQSRESVPLRHSRACFGNLFSTWHTQPLSERIQRHITRPRWQCLHFHLARPIDCRASHSNDVSISLFPNLLSSLRHSRTCFGNLFSTCHAQQIAGFASNDVSISSFPNLFFSFRHSRACLGNLFPPGTLNP